MFKIAGGTKPPADWSQVRAADTSTSLFAFIECCWAKPASSRPTISDTARVFRAQLAGDIAFIEKLAVLDIRVARASSRKRKPTDSLVNPNSTRGRRKTQPNIPTNPIQSGQHKFFSGETM
jgi:hypothetical protein